MQARSGLGYSYLLLDFTDRFLKIFLGIIAHSFPSMRWTRMVDPQSQCTKINLGSADSVFGYGLEHEQGPQKSPQEIANQAIFRASG